MKFIAKEPPKQELGLGDVIEYVSNDDTVVRYIVVRAWDGEGLWRYGLIDLDHSEQLPQLFDYTEEVLKQFINYNYRIIKSSDLEMREV